MRVEPPNVHGVGGTGRNANLVGRELALAQLHARFDQARVGRGGVVTLCATAGMGKTALLNAFAKEAGTRGLRCSGVESEVELPFSGLHHLLLPLAEQFDHLPPNQRAAILAAISLQPDQAVSTTDVALGTLDLLTTSRPDDPALIIVDDAHWLDPATLDVLSFVARRLDCDNTLMVVGTRPTTQPLGFDGVQLKLSPLDATETAILAERTADRALPEGTARAIHRATGGNPLAIIVTIQRQLDDLDRLGTELDEPPPVAELIRLGLASRVARLTPDARLAVAVAATAVTDSADVIDASVAALGLSAEALDPAEDAGLIARQLGTITFAHPLLRSLVFHEICATDRRRVNGALAQAETDRGLRAWYSAAAARGTDETLATELAAAAEGFRSRGGALMAARVLERAAMLSGSTDLRAARLLAAGQCAREATRLDYAARLLDGALAANEDQRLALEIRSERIRLYGRPAEGAALDGAEELALARDAREVDPELARDQLARGLVGMAIDGQAPAAVALLEQLESLPPTGGPADALVEATRGIVLVLSGSDPAAGRAALIGCATSSRVPLPLTATSAVVEGLIWVEAFDEASAMLDARLREARATGDERSATSLLAVNGYRLYRTGEWTRAERLVRDTARVSEASGDHYYRAISLGTLALLQGARGDAETMQTISAARLLASRYGYEDIEPHLRAAVGAYAVATGDLRAGLEALETMEAWCQAGGYTDPGVFSWQSDLVDLYVQAGREVDALKALQRLRRRSAGIDRAGPAAAIARLEGVLAQDGYAESFERALALLDTIPAPFEQARTRLQFGERLATDQQTEAAREQLVAASRIFAELPAPVWLNATSAALARIGAEAVRPTPSPLAELTPQERAVAERVASGLSNKEAAEALFVTTKTIEWHLSQIYRKLGIRSRTQLVALMGGTLTARASPAP